MFYILKYNTLDNISTIILYMCFVYIYIKKIIKYKMFYFFKTNKNVLNMIRDSMYYFIECLK